MFKEIIIILCLALIASIVETRRINYNNDQTETFPIDNVQFEEIENYKKSDIKEYPKNNIPVIKMNNEEISGGTKLSVLLPNNTELIVKIDFELIRPYTLENDEIVPNEENGFKGSTKNDVEGIYNSPSTTTSAPPQEHQKRSTGTFSISEAIEQFRRDLIKKELNIGGILESDKPFYRHFKVTYKNFQITVRCTYTAFFHAMEFRVSCFEYREREAERILANGDVEIVKIGNEVPDPRNDVEIEDINHYTQEYHMKHMD